MKKQLIPKLSPAVIEKLMKEIEILSVQSYNNEKFSPWISNSLTKIQLQLKKIFFNLYIKKINN